MTAPGSAMGCVGIGHPGQLVFRPHGGGNLEGLIEARRRLDEFHETLRETERDNGDSALFAAIKWSAAVLGAAAVSWIVYSLFRARCRQGRSGEVIETRRGLSGILPADPVARIVDEFQDAHYGAAAPPDSAGLDRLESGRQELEDFLRDNPPGK